jgi:parafibromin
MATPDALQLLRSAIIAGKPPVLTTSSDPSIAESSQTDSFVDATHLYFNHPSPLCLPLSTTTRFVSTTPDTAEVDSRSVWFAWLKRETNLPDVLAEVAELEKQLPESQKIRNLIFIERLDLITWLQGASEESEYIKPLEGPAAEASKAADVAGGAGVPTVAGTGLGVTQQTAGGRPIKVIDARLQAIYKGERKMGDHNTVLRGIKPTVHPRVIFLSMSN